MAKRLLRREHVVAASLVGAVVVVIGFASGLGSRPGTGASAAPEPAPGGQEPPAATAPVTPAQAQPPQGGSPGYSGGGGGGAAVPVTTMPAQPPGTGHTGHPTAPATTTTPPTTTTSTPGAPCEPGLVPTALDTLLGTLGSATGALGLGAAPAVVGTTAALLPALPAGTPLDQLLATCPTPTTTTTPTAGHGG